jgi:hypothetical protein
MAALTQDRDTPFRGGKDFAFPVAAGATIYAGALVVLEAGVAKPGTLAADLIALGVAQQRVVNTGADGAVSVPVRRDGLYRFDNSTGADAITLANVGSPAWIVDDHTVALTGAVVSGAATRSIAGTIRDVDATGVWLQF